MISSGLMHDQCSVYILTWPHTWNTSCHWFPGHHTCLVLLYLTGCSYSVTFSIPPQLPNLYLKEAPGLSLWSFFSFLSILTTLMLIQSHSFKYYLYINDPKFISLAQTYPLESSLIYSTVNSTFVCGCLLAGQPYSPQPGQSHRGLTVRRASGLV